MSICMMKPIVLQYESSVRPIALCTYELSLHTHASLYTDALENPPPKNVPTECQSYIIQITHKVPIRQLSLCRPHILMHLKILGPVFEATCLLSLLLISGYSLMILKISTLLSYVFSQKRGTSSSPKITGASASSTLPLKSSVSL